MPRLFFLFGLIFSLISHLNRLNAQAPYQARIIRDSFGVPHVFGQRDADVAYGLAYAHAEDNFQDIQHQLLAARGRLGEVLGKDGALFDFALQFFGIDTFVERFYERDLSPGFRLVLDGYVAGLNDYARNNPKEVLIKNSLPFTDKDLVKGYTLTMTLMAGAGMALKAINDDRIEVMFSPNERGSNASALSATRSEDGRTWLSINSHQPIEGRFAWYEAHVQSQEGWDMIGGLFPGGMTIFVGTNPNLGWGHTVNYHNFGDLYRLKVHKNKKQYWYDGQWRKFGKRKAKLKVKLGPIKLGLKRKILDSDYGPVFVKRKQYYALRFPAPSNIQAAEQWYRMNKAQNLPEFEAALRLNALSLFNVIYADKEDNLFYISDGMIPKRDSSLNWSPPIEGISSAHKWTELLPYEAKVQYRNPACGFVFNCNNTPLSATCFNENHCEINYLGLQLFMYNRGDRYQRLFNELPDTVTWADFLRIKYDKQYDPEGKYMRNFGAFFRLSPQRYPNLAEGIEILQNWDLKADSNSLGAGLMFIVHKELVKTDKLPFGFYMIQTDTISEEKAALVLSRALKYMKKTYGTVKVPLGRIQRLIRGQESYAVEGMSEVPRAVDASLYDKKKGIFRMHNGDGYIQFVKYGKGETEVLSINAYGASAHPKSPHYTDQMKPFIREETRRVPWRLEEIKAQARYDYMAGERGYR